MRPMLANYLAQVQRDQAQNAGSPETPNPFHSGIQSAMEGIRQSSGMSSTSQQRDQAIGQGFIKYGQSLSDPYAGEGLQGINQALGNGIDAYTQQRAQQAEMNAQLYAEAVRQQEAQRNYERQMAALQGQQERHAQTLGQQKQLHQETLAENKRAHNLAHEDRLAKIAAKGKEQFAAIGGEPEEGLYGTEYIPLPSLLDPKGRERTDEKEYKKLAAKEIATLDVNRQALAATKDMREIFNKYPDIGSSFLNALTESEGEGSDLFTIIGKKIANMSGNNSEKLDAVQRLKKLTSDLNLDVIMGSSGKTATNMFKEMVKEASASGKLQKGALDYITNKIDKKVKHKINKIKVYEDAQKKGKMALFSSMDEFEEEPPSGVSAEPLQQWQSNSGNEGANISAAATDGRQVINVKTPDGKIHPIYADKLGEAQRRGAVQVEQL